MARKLFRGEVDPLHLVQFRMLVGGGLLLAMAAFRRELAFPRAALPSLVLYAVALAGVQATYFLAIRSAGVATAIFLQYTAPLLLAGFEAVRQRRLPPRPLLLALGAATAGSALLVLPGGTLRVPVAGFALGLASAVCFAVDTHVAAGLRRQGVLALPLLAYGLAIGSCALLPLRSPLAALTAVPRGALPFFLFIAVFATAIPFAFYVAALKHLPGSVALLLAMLEPVLAALLAWALLGETLSLAQLGGGALNLGGLGLAAKAASR